MVGGGRPLLGLPEILDQANHITSEIPISNDIRSLRLSRNT